MLQLDIIKKKLKKKIYGNHISFLSLNKHSQLTQPANTASPASQSASTDITSMFNYDDYDDYVVNPRLKKPEKFAKALAKAEAKAKAKAKALAYVKASTKNLRTVGNNYKQFVTTETNPKKAYWDWERALDLDLESEEVIVFSALRS